MQSISRRNIVLVGGITLMSGLLPLPSAWALTKEDVAFGKKLLAAVPPHGEKTLGRPEAPVVVLEYASATCPHCAEFHMSVLPELKKSYIDTGKVRFIFREFPLDQRALAVFMLTRCVPVDKYFPTLDLVFRRQKLWNSDKAKTELLKIMQMTGMSETEFDACLKREELAKAIIATGNAANKDFGVKGTPAIYVNGKFIDGHEEPSALFAAIEAALAAN